jgi:D-glycero-D-manno-heptose 1,7-bisphosphate phosphatase
MLCWVTATQARPRRVLFLDRDGVINRDRPDYVKGWEEFEFHADVPDTLTWLAKNDVGVILISNQSGLNRGIIDPNHFWDLHHRMISRIRLLGGNILAAFYCPHRPDENCRCRKPSPEMILFAGRLYDIPLAESYYVGDRQSDILAARRAGCRAVLLERAGEHRAGQPYGPTEVHQALEQPDLRCATLLDAVFAVRDEFAPGAAGLEGQPTMRGRR